MNEWRRCALKHREFVYVGEPVPKIDPTQNADFILQLQKSMLVSLVKRKLLNISQMERVMEELEHGHRLKNSCQAE